MIAGALNWISIPVALFIGGIGAVSVFKAVYIDRRELKCACVGGDSNVPLGFVSDHMEVLWDLDNEAMTTAREHAILAERVPTPGVHPAFVSGLVDLVAERDFVGKAALLAQGQQKQFLGLLLLDKGVLRAHQKVVTVQGDGEITSGTFSPTLQQSVALARLPMGVAIGDSVKVVIRDKELAAKVVKPCFARNGKSMI